MKALISILVLFSLVLDVFLMESSRIGYDRGYDKGLEDGIRMTNEVLSEVIADERP